MAVKIYPDGDNFMVRLSRQELKNLVEGLLARRENSPWNLGTIRQMNTALADQSEYQAKVWDESL